MKNNSGFTVVEVLLSIAIAGILIMAAIEHTNIDEYIVNLFNVL